VFSLRSALPGEVHPLATLRERLAREGRAVLDWSHGNPTSVGLPWPDARVVEAFASARWLAYEPLPLGLPAAREALAAHLHAEGLRVFAEEVVLVASTSEAYANLFKILCDAGDEVLVPAPSYPLFDELARWEGITLRPYRLAFAGEWHLDLDSVRAAIGPRTRAILVVSPNNPTGSCLTRSELEALASFGLPIVSDEVFATSPASGQGRTLSVRDALPDHPHVVLDGLSKRLALPQVKCGWMLLGGPRAFCNELRERLEYALDAQLALAAPVQHALPALLALEADARAALASRIGDSERAVRGAIAGSAVSLLPREAGWSLALRFPCEDDARFAERLLDERGIYVAPGSFFAFERPGYAVASGLVPPEVADRAARALVEAVHAS
jgi:alanine-synthesizing transaminase